MGTNLGYYARVVPGVSDLATLSQPIIKVMNPNSTELQPICLKFWYYFAGSVSPNTFIKVQVITSDGKTVRVSWKRNPVSVNSEKQWLYGRATFYAGYKDQIQILAQTNDTNTYIAIDDVIIQDEECELPGW